MINPWEAIKQRHLKLNSILITIHDQSEWAAFGEVDFKIIIGDMSNDISRYFGMDLQAQRHKLPDYIDIGFVMIIVKYILR